VNRILRSVPRRELALEVRDPRSDGTGQMPFFRGGFRMHSLTAAILVALAATPRSAPVSGPPVVQPPQFITSWGCEGDPEPFFCTDGDDPGDIWLPGNIAVNAAGEVFVEDNGHNRLQKYDRNGGFLASYPYLRVIATDDDGNLYALAGGKVRKFGPGGGLVLEWDQPGGAVDVGPQGLVHVVDGAVGKVHVFTPDGQLVRSWGTLGLGEEELYAPRLIAVAPDGDVFIFDNAYTYTKHFAPDGTYLGSLSLGYLQAMTFDDKGRLLVTTGDGFTVFDRDGNLLLQVTDAAGEPIGTGFGLAARGPAVYVANAFTGRIYKFVFAHVVTSNPPGLLVDVDGIPRQTPVELDWAAGERHEIGGDSQPLGTESRYVFRAWSDEGARSHAVHVPETYGTWTASFDGFHRLQMAAMAGVRTRPETSWYPEGETVTISAEPPPPFEAIAWTGTGDGSFSGTGLTASVTMSGPVSEYAEAGATVVPHFDFSISASDVDPFANAAAPAQGDRSLYLWGTCLTNGLAALELGTSGTLPVSDFTPLNGCLNAGSATSLLLAVPACPIGPAAHVLLGRWTVNDVGGTLCAGPSDGNRIVAVECGSQALGDFDPGVRGFSSDASDPCWTGDGCGLGPAEGAAPASLAGRAARSPEDPLKLGLAGGNPTPGPVRLVLGVPAASRSSVTVYDVRGRRIRELQSGVLEAGRHIVEWDGSTSGGGRASDGVYFVRLQTDDAVRTAKVVLTRTR
jgi:DNA-binding beta-propeller fold protein YncE